MQDFTYKPNVFQRPSTYLKILGIILLLTAALGSFISYTHLKTPLPTGSYPIGRNRLGWTDSSRKEIATSPGSDEREVITEIWYPAKNNTGTKASYVPELQSISKGLVQSGEVNSFETFGLKYVRSHTVKEAEVIDANLPVVILSPGNATNIEFYSSYAEELASNGFIVFGINHPYDVAAVRLQNNDIAIYSPEASADLGRLETRIEERLKDITFLIKQIEILNKQGTFKNKIDLEHIGVAGHSLGGITAAQACMRESKVKACVNIDGIQEGGPYAIRRTDQVLAKPFLFITKENPSPALGDLIIRDPFLKNIVIPGVSHSDFADGPLFEPSILPIERPVDKAIRETRKEMLKFFQEEMK
jgi:dienelactone hydrolase